MSRLTMRRARRDEVAAIVALYADDELGRTREEPAALERYLAAFDRLAADPEHQQLIVAVRQGEIVGTLQLTFIPQLSSVGQLVAQVESVRIASHCRGEGLGAELLSWAIATCRAAGCARLQLASHSSRVAAQRFYRRLGFVASHVGMKLPL